MTCPPFEELLALCAFPDAGIAAERSAEVRRHLDDGCERCQQRLSLATRLADSIGVRPLVSSSKEQLDSLVQRALAIPQAVRAAGPKLLTLVNEGTASPSLAAAHLRAEGSSEPHWLYRGDDWELDIAVLEPGVLAGQLLATDGRALLDGGCVLHSDRGAEQTALESSGEFLFEGLQPERYSLLVDVAELSISVPEIDLTAESGAL